MEEEIQELLDLLRNDFADYLPFREDELSPRWIYLDVINKIEYYIRKKEKIHNIAAAQSNDTLDQSEEE